MAALCFAVAGLLALSASPALAAETHPYTGTSFGPDGVGGTGSFEGVRSVAVDPASGAVYVYDAGAGAIYKFDSDGVPLNFADTGTNSITGVGGSAGGAEFQIALAPAGSPGGTAGDIYVANNGEAVHVYSADGTELGEIAQGGETCGVATDPSGNFYAGIFEKTVRKFTPTGNPPTASDQSGTGTVNQGICNVAADGLGNVYAANYFSSGLYKLEGLADAEPSQVDPQANTVGIAPGSNDVYADRGSVVYQYDSAGNSLGNFGAGEISQSRGVAINSGATKIYVGTQGKVKVFGPTALVPDAKTEAVTALTRASVTLNGTVNAAGGPEATCRFQYVTANQYFTEGFEGAAEKPCSPAGPFTGSSDNAVSAVATGLTTETEYFYRLVGSSENGQNVGEALSFRTPGAVNVETKPATGRTQTTATLNGTINPEGTELEECSFEYGPDGGYGTIVPCAETPAEIGAGNAPVAVHAEVGALIGGSEYHYRLVAENEFGTSAGADESFRAAGPAIEFESLFGITETSAGFKARINPNGEATTYYVEYVTEAEYAANGFANAVQVPSGGEPLGEGSSGVEIDQELSGLIPLTTYRAHVVAGNPSGEVDGSDLRFTTFDAPSDGLADGRAYEQVTPVNKNGGSAQGNANRNRAAPAGNGITFFLNGGLPGAEGAQNLGIYLSLRDQDGWSTQGLLPPSKLGTYAEVLGLSEDLGVSYSNPRTPSPGGIYEKDTKTLLTSPVFVLEGSESEPKVGESELIGASDDKTTALFEMNRLSEPGDNPNQDLYLSDKDSGEFVLAGVLNDGEAPTEGAKAGAYEWYNSGESGSQVDYYNQQHHILSADGSRLFFTSENDLQLYMRTNPVQDQSALAGGGQCTEPTKACTVKISDSQRTSPDPGGSQPAKFVEATKSGSKVLFMSSAELTDESNTGSADNSDSLYSYDTATGALTDLTPSDLGENPAGAEVAGVMGMSADGSHVYFEAGGALAPGATPGYCPQALRRIRDYAECNVYLWQEGELSFITQVKGASQVNVAPASTRAYESSHDSRVSSDGRTVVFSSLEPLTDQVTGGYVQFFRYNLDGDQLTCMSCLPTGEPPRAGVTLHNIVVRPFAPSSLSGGYATRNLNGAGTRFFFESADKLVGGDTNGVQDVYEWEAVGTGSCSAVRENGGCLSLISTGHSPEPSYFADASESGNDAYFYTGQPLVGQDLDELVDIYDARVGGGLPSQFPAPPSICTGEACRGQVPAPPSEQSPGTSTFSGPGNQKPKKHHNKRHHKRKHHKKRHHKQTKGSRTMHREGNR